MLKWCWPSTGPHDSFVVQMNHRLAYWIPLLILFAPGCAKKHDEPPAAGKKPGPRKVNGGDRDYDNGGDRDYDQNLPGDKFERHPMGGHIYNRTREERRHRRAVKILARMKAGLHKKKPKQLIEMILSCDKCFGWTIEGVDYYVRREGNRLIERELQRRGATIRPTLVKCVTDRRRIFTGYAGPPDTIGRMCKRLLDKVDKARRGSGPRPPAPKPPLGPE